MTAVSFPASRCLCFLAASTLALPGQSTYDLTVYNNFGQGEYYGVTPSDSDIWLLSNFQFDYKSKSTGQFVTGNASAGTYTAINLNDIDGGAMKIYDTTNGTRMYAVLSTGATPPTTGSLATSPNSYFEWSFSAGNPGTFDMSWIDSYDFLTRMEIQTTGSTYPGPNKVTFGAGSTLSSAAVGNKLQSYVDRPSSPYGWLSVGTGFSQTLSYDSINPTRWITNNSGTAGAVNAQNIQSFTNALNTIASTAVTKPAWAPGTPASGPNWTDKGFRISGLQGVNAPNGDALSATPNMWSAYVNFSNSGGYSLELTDFTIYGGTGTGASYEILWNSVTDAGGEVYSLTQADGLLNAIWTSSVNDLTNTPSWVSNLGANQNILFYALYNAIASGLPYDADFLNNTEIPSWTGYVPYVEGQDIYNFEILFKGAQVSAAEFEGGLTGNLTGTDLISLLMGRDAAGDLVNPYLLELLSATEQTPAYLYPSQDFWGYISVGDNTEVGLQPGPLNGAAVFGDATLDWYIGSGVNVPEPQTYALLIGCFSLAGAWYFRRQKRKQL